eukprot:1201326-Amphidinium_carterae.2
MAGHQLPWACNVYLDRHPSTAKGGQGFPMVLKAVYDEDWVDEAGMLAYFNQDPGWGEAFRKPKRQQQDSYLGSRQPCLMTMTTHVD